MSYKKISLLFLIISAPLFSTSFAGRVRKSLVSNVVSTSYEHHSIQLCNSLIDNSITETETESEEIDSPEVERLREDLLDGIDEDSDLCTSIHDLDSFMKSFEEEITTSPTSSHGSGAAEERIVESASDCGESGEVEEGIVELVSDSGELRPDLGYLLEASDDELGIPPPAASPARKELVTG
ncbi:hypothetical protein SASPL_126122 [Salvia splendens]|uniref:Uncharacterized protein n=1 Tax=Salvia splendens TaxID=180675 RepID=A0A8X8ZQN7_SALSN|nr:hypothetical protein SASPL_126122 [Salvia splendens]